MRRRLRSTIKWCCTSMTVLLLIAWIGSGLWWISFLPRDGSFAMGVHRGTLAVKWARPAQVLPEKYLGWDFGRDTRLKVRWWFQYETGTSFGSKTTEVVIPIWPAAFLFAVPTACLWYRDRRRAPGHCPHCNYNLHANTTGTCPECGTSVRAAAAS